MSRDSAWFAFDMDDGLQEEASTKRGLLDAIGMRWGTVREDIKIRRYLSGTYEARFEGDSRTYTLYIVHGRKAAERDGWEFDRETER